MVLEASLINTHRYKVWIKGKEKRFPLRFGVVAIESGALK